MRLICMASIKHLLFSTTDELERLGLQNSKLWRVTKLLQDRKLRIYLINPSQDLTLYLLLKPHRPGHLSILPSPSHSADCDP